MSKIEKLVKNDNGDTHRISVETFPDGSQTATVIETIKRPGEAPKKTKEKT